MGELNSKPFQEAVKRKYNEVEAEDRALEMCSLSRFHFEMSKIDSLISSFGHNQCTKLSQWKISFILDYWWGWKISIFLKTNKVKVGLPKYQFERMGVF